MDKPLVYDLPTRVFHWSFAVLFAAAFTIAKTIDDESMVFPWHMMAGLTAVFAVLLRLFWGLAGTRHARFADFVLSPREALRYLGGILNGDKRRWAGHNPASSWTAVLMMGVALALGLSGWLMTTGGDKEAIEDIHELVANVFLILVVLHVAGVVLHTLRHGEMIARSMVDGRKPGVPEAEAIASARAPVGALFMALVAGFVALLGTNFDPGQGTLRMFGATLQVGESAREELDHEHVEDEHD